MGESKGPILFTGSVGNIRMYYNRFLKRWIVSTKGGQNKDLVKTSKQLARQRENMAEFNACSKWTSQLRRSLLSISHLHQGYYFSQIMKLAKIIQKHDDVHDRGFRSIASSQDAHLLTSINFNTLHPFDQVFSQQYALEFSSDFRTITLQLLGFKSLTRITWPERYESYRVSLVIAQLPDFAWNERASEFWPVLPDMQKLSVATFSDWLPRSSEPCDLILSASFLQPALQSPGTTVIVALGVEVSMGTGILSTESLPGSGTMKIIACYV